MMIRKTGFATLMLLLAGCGTAATDEATKTEGNSEESISQIGSSIIGGVETSGSTAVVALYGPLPPGPNGENQGGALCTATFISPTVLITAAHCVHPDVAKGVTQFYILRSPNLVDESAEQVPAIPVKSVHYNPKWSSTNLPAGFDVAVAVLDQPVTDVTPVAVNTTALNDAFLNKPAHIIGYGLNDGFGQTGAGIKREATVKLNSWDAQFVRTGSWFGTTICTGDSGGPILVDINGVETLVAVNSFGFIFCIGEASSTRTDANLDFLQQYLPAAPAAN